MRTVILIVLLISTLFSIKYIFSLNGISGSNVRPGNLTFTVDTLCRIQHLQHTIRSVDTIEFNSFSPLSMLMCKKDNTKAMFIVERTAHIDFYTDLCGANVRISNDTIYILSNIFVNTEFRPIIVDRAIGTCFDKSLITNCLDQIDMYDIVWFNKHVNDITLPKYFATSIPVSGYHIVIEGKIIPTDAENS